MTPTHTRNRAQSLWSLVTFLVNLCFYCSLPREQDPSYYFWQLLCMVVIRTPHYRFCFSLSHHSKLQNNLTHGMKKLYTKFPWSFEHYERRRRTSPAHLARGQLFITKLPPCFSGDYLLLLSLSQPEAVQPWQYQEVDANTRPPVSIMGDGSPLVKPCLHPAVLHKLTVKLSQVITGRYRVLDL